MTPKLYKASEVCDAAGLQPYVLRSWEKEFPGIGVQKSQDSTRLYRQSDLDQVLRIKQLVFGEGLTLSGARRRLEEAMPAPTPGSEPGMAEVLDTLDADARARIDLVRQGLRSILDVLSKRAGAVALAELPRNGSSGGQRRASPGARKPLKARRPGALASKPRKAASTRGTAARKDAGKRKRVRRQY
ncbi:MAG: hypothetical protein A3H29_17685 [Acidobacteria bacterium RIFCSPLOWO2_02_FULL_67_21]|nr:MAG: hypothetical protein A3H29_17685 [Acidobacteria bacterium RIFCSPLOWO2_02_FULL_67_21]